jgi:hypothetical protein
MNELTNLAAQFEALEVENLRLNEVVRESLIKKMMDIEDIGWKSLFGSSYDEDDSGLDLDSLHSLSRRLRDEAVTNPLHVRGAQLRHSYVFGRGMYLTDLGKAEDAVKDPYNLQALFSVQAFETNNLALFTDGNLIVLRDEKTQQLTIVPITQIHDVGLDPDDNAKIRYLKRVWSSGGKERELWYPLARFKKSRVGRGKRRTQTGGIQKSIRSNQKTIPVSQDTVAYVHSTKRQGGWTFGVPDSLAAVIWSQAYKEYLSDNATLVKALSQLAWKVTTATKVGQDNAAAQVKVPGVGGTAVIGQGNDVSAVSRGSDVNFNNGQPLAAMVASSFGVPVIALLSSPGATGGSYGAAQTLDEPTLKGMKSTQDAWVVLYQEILTDMGADNPIVAFPNISQDATYREAQSAATAYEGGALWQDEYRQAILDLLDVQKKHDGVPVSPVEKQAARDEQAAKAALVAKQGQTGAVPGGQNQGVTDHSTENE